MCEDARLGLIAVIGALVLFAWDRGGEQLARVGDVVGADAACEQSVMADAREPVALIVQGALPSFSCPGCDLVLGLPLFEMLGASRRFNVKPGGG